MIGAREDLRDRLKILEFHQLKKIGILNLSLQFSIQLQRRRPKMRRGEKRLMKSKRNLRKKWMRKPPKTRQRTMLEERNYKPKPRLGRTNTKRDSIISKG